MLAESPEASAGLGARHLLHSVLHEKLVLVQEPWWQSQSPGLGVKPLPPVLPRAPLMNLKKSLLFDRSMTFPERVICSNYRFATPPGLTWTVLMVPPKLQ